MEPVFIRHSKVVKKTLPRAKFGIPGLDKLLGGGLVSGTITLIEEDHISKHYISFLRCFLGEGAANKEKLFIYSNTPVQGIIPSLGKVQKQLPGQYRIAWRYDKNTEISPDTRVYDLSKSVNYPIHHSRISDTHLYEHLYTDISNSIETSTDTCYRRIVIMMETEEWPERELNIFMVSLRSLMRSLNACCVITTSLGDVAEMKRVVMRKGADFVVHVKEVDAGNAFSEYCGVIDIVKPLRVMSLGNYELAAKCYGIVKDNKYINVENLSLPPADSMQKTNTLDY